MISIRLQNFFVRFHDRRHQLSSLVLEYQLVVHDDDRAFPWEPEGAGGRRERGKVYGRFEEIVADGVQGLYLGDEGIKSPPATDEEIQTFHRRVVRLYHISFAVHSQNSALVSNVLVFQETIVENGRFIGKV